MEVKTFVIKKNTGSNVTINSYTKKII